MPLRQPWKGPDVNDKPHWMLSRALALALLIWTAGCASSKPPSVVVVPDKHLPIFPYVVPASRASPSYLDEFDRQTDDMLKQLNELSLTATPANSGPQR
jgi:hypothetical protein